MSETAESENPTTGPIWARVGFGASVTGGAQSGQTVLTVTTLASTGVGSLRSHLAASGVRLIKFAVSGDIDLGASNISITTGDVTVDGTGGPDGGVCIKNGRIDIAANNVVIRYVRFRSGDFVGLSAGSSDSLDVVGADGVIIDHCSVSWGLDECLTVYNGSQNVTIQNTIVSEGLNCNTVNPHPETCHSRGLFVQNNATRVTIYHVAIINSYLRTIEVDSGDFEFVNCIVYGNGISTVHCELTITVRGNVLGNWWQVTDIHDNPSNPSWLRAYDVANPTANANSRWHLADNVSLDCTSGASGCQAAMTELDAGQLQGSPLAFPITSWTSAAQAKVDIIAENIGASRPCRDSVDTRVMADMVQGIGNPAVVATTGGLVNNVSDVGGYPDLTVPCPSSGIFRGGKFHMRVL